MKLQRHTLLFLFLGLVFAAPGIAAYWFYTHDTWLTQSTTNQGTLLNPPLQLPLPLTPKKWHVVLWAGDGCDRACIAALDKIARVRLALGRRLYEVIPTLLLDATAPSLSPDLLSTLQAQEIQVLRWSESTPWPLLDKNSPLVLADPAYRAILIYPLSTPPDALFHDLKQLLRS